MIIEGINRIRGFELVKDAPAGTKLPVLGSIGAAGYDFFAPCDIVVPAHSFSKLVPLNIKAYMPDGEFLALVIRSSYAIKEKYGHLMVAQGTAIIDQDYYSNPTNDGNIGVMFYNRSGDEIIIREGERCCQGIFQPYFKADKIVALKVRVGGYGSTGEK